VVAMGATSFNKPISVFWLHYAFSPYYQTKYWSQSLYTINWLVFEAGKYFVFGRVINRMTDKLTSSNSTNSI